MTAQGLSKKALRKAGWTLADASADERSHMDAAEVVNAWRELHVPVLQALFGVVSEASGLRDDVLVAGRIKKFDTIVDKLQRANAVKNLDTMYDIVGCRIVFPDLNALDLACRDLLAMGCWDLGKTSKHDYLAQPRESGYRGRHLIFAYQDKENGYGLNAELQLRTALQHAWATAVEMYDMAVAGSRLKFNETDNLSGSFFRMASDLICCHESQDERRLSDKRDLIDELRKADERGGILSVLESAGRSVFILERPEEVCAQDYCLVDFNVPEQSLVLKKLPVESAVQEYFRAECEASREGSGHNMVLVRGTDIEKLEKAYPNYFGDISLFTEFMRAALY